MDCRVCFHRQLSYNTVEPRGYTIGLLLPLRGINKTPWVTVLLLMGILAYSVDCACLCHILTVPLSSSGYYNLPSAPHPFPSPLDTICGITGVYLNIQLTIGISYEILATYITRLLILCIWCT